MKLRAGKLAAAIPVVGIVALALTGCQVHAGAASVVDGHRISEQTVNSYINPNSKPISLSDGSTQPPRSFVLQALIQEQVLNSVFAANGGVPTEAALTQVKATALQGNTEDQLLSSVTKLGLSAGFEPHLLRIQELAALLSTKFSSVANANTVLAKYSHKVSVSARYGSWDAAALSLSDFTSKQVPGFITFNTPLTSTSAPAAP